ncbi:MAG: hypothetical protein FH758_08970 [Firmicutes bacterium]|nr:hypothetical protein [Bacillota bacterium]
MDDELESMEELKKHFADRFKFTWNHVMLGADKPFSHHKDWNAYFSVAKFEKGTKNYFLSDLNLSKGYNVIIG